MKYKQPRPVFKVRFPCPFSTRVTMCLELYMAKFYKAHLFKHFKHVNTKLSQTDLFDAYMESLQILLLWDRVEFGVMTTKK